MNISKRDADKLTFGVEFKADKNGKVHVVLTAIDEDKNAIEIWCKAMQAKTLSLLLLKGAAKLENVQSAQ